MMSKYCEKYHPVIKKPGKGASHTWKQLCKIKDKVEEQLVWLVEGGNVSFWYDNWTSLGPLCNFLGEENRPRYKVERGLHKW